MEYYNQCGNCIEYKFAGSNKKGFCEWYRCYYYPDDSCNHQKNRKEDQTGCFITTIICDILGYDDNCDVLNNLRNFRNNIMQKDITYRPLLLEYDIIGPKIANNIKIEYETNKDKSLWQKIYDIYLVPTSNLIKEAHNNKAVCKYREMVNILKEYYSLKLEMEDIRKINNYDMSTGGHGKVKSLT